MSVRKTLVSGKKESRKTSVKKGAAVLVDIHMGSSGKFYKDKTVAMFSFLRLNNKLKQNIDSMSFILTHLLRPFLD